MSGKQLAGVVSVLALLVVLFLMAPGAASAGDWTGQANFFLGQKMLKSGDWEPVEDQPEFGAEVSWGKKSWPILIATDVFGSSDEQTVSGVKLEGNTSELDLGIRKIWGDKNVHGFLGGGFANIHAEAKATLSGLSGSVDDSSPGAWVGGGVFWRLGTRFNIGLSGRLSRATVTFSGVDVEAGGSHAGLLLGWGWPATK